MQAEVNCKAAIKTCTFVLKHIKADIKDRKITYIRQQSKG